MDVRSHPLGLESPAIRITMYNPQVAEISPRSREACAEIAHSYIDARPDERCDLGARSRRGVRALPAADRDHRRDWSVHEVVHGEARLDDLIGATAYRQQCNTVGTAWPIAPREQSGHLSVRHENARPQTSDQ